MKEQIRRNASRPPSAVYGLGFIGAVIYFIQTATGFWMGVTGFFKAIIWPVILVYKVLQYLKV